MGYKVLIPQEILDEGKDWLRARGYEIKMGSGITADDIARDVVDCDAILARTAPFPARVLEAGKKLRVIGRHGIGYDNIDVARATELGIWVTNAPESNAGSVAEYAMGCIIALARNFIRSDRETRAGNWLIRDKMVGSDLEGKVLGIAGLGKIGRRLARKASLGMEMKVIGYDPYLAPEAFPEYATPVATWEELFASVGLHQPPYARRGKEPGDCRQEGIFPDEEDGLPHQCIPGRCRQRGGTGGGPEKRRHRGRRPGRLCPGTAGKGQPPVLSGQCLPDPAQCRADP